MLKEIIERERKATKGKSHAYKMGMDCGLRGANERNCSFSIFSSHAKTTQWEQGRAEADALLKEIGE